MGRGRGRGATGNLLTLAVMYGQGVRDYVVMLVTLLR